MSYQDKVQRFLDLHSTDANLSEDVVVVNEFQEGSILGIQKQTRSISSPKKKDDGLTGDRYAIMYKSIELDGIYQVQDPGIVDVVSSLKDQNISIFLHYGFAAGTSGLAAKHSATDITKMSRFYELVDSSDSPTTERLGHIALVEMKGVNHGKIIDFLEEGSGEIAPRDAPEEPPAPPPERNFIAQEPRNPEREVPVANKTLDDYLQEGSGLPGGLEHKSYTLVRTGRKADSGAQDLWKIQLDGADLRENRWQGDSLVMTATKEAWDALIIMEKYWDRLRVIRRFNKHDMADTDWVPLISFISNSYRSEVVNARREGAHGSQHIKGNAFDVARAKRIDKKLWARLFVLTGKQSGFKGFGIGNGFCHADTRPLPGSWDYRGNVSSYAPEEFLIPGTTGSNAKVLYGDLAAKVDLAAITTAWGSENWQKAFTL